MERGREEEKKKLLPLLSNKLECPSSYFNIKKKQRKIQSQNVNIKESFHPCSFIVFLKNEWYIFYRCFDCGKQLWEN